MRYRHIWWESALAFAVIGTAAAQNYYIPDYHHRGAMRCGSYADPNDRAACRNERRAPRNYAPANDQPAYERPAEHRSFAHTDHTERSAQESLEAATQAETPLARKLDAVVRVDSQNWMLNHYIYGSVRNAKVLSHAKDGTITYYGEYSFNQGETGWVKVKMKGADVRCIAFADDQQCRAVGDSLSKRAMENAMTNSGGGGGNGGGGCPVASGCSGLDHQGIPDVVTFNHVQDQNH